MKIRLGAVIPTVQYGNLQPEFELDTADYLPPRSGGYIVTEDMLMADLEGRIQALWDKYGEKPLTTNSNSKRLKAFVGGEIDYDAGAHAYSWNGQAYLSGSQYAKQFEKPFDAQKISQALAEKFKVDGAEIRKLWELKADISKGLGTMIHSALEMYGRYSDLAAALDKTTNLHDHPIVKKAVESFYEAHKDKAEYEALIVDHQNKRAGQVDRLVILGDKHCRVEDYKCNAVMTPEKLKVYWKQLEFYGEIMEANGWKVDPPVIHHWDGEWKEYKHDDNRQD